MGKQKASLVSQGMTLLTETQPAKELSMKRPETLIGEKRPTKNRGRYSCRKKLGTR